MFLAALACLSKNQFVLKDYKKQVRFYTFSQTKNEDVDQTVQVYHC